MYLLEQEIDFRFLCFPLLSFAFFLFLLSLSASNYIQRGIEIYLDLHGNS